MVDTLDSLNDEHQYVSRQSFPSFGQVHVERLKCFGVEEVIDASTSLYARGQRGIDMFVVLSGILEIFESGGQNQRTVVAVLRDQQFTGELDLLDSRESLLDCRTVTTSRVLRIKRAELQRVMRSEPDIANLIMQACIGRHFDILRHAAGGVLIVGNGQSGDVIRLQRFLTRNEYPHRVMDTDKDHEAATSLNSFSVEECRLPLVLLPGDRILCNPSNAHLADELGLTSCRDASKVYDVAIVGAGPAGLGAAVYAASEGLSTVVVEGAAPGGQAGTSSKIENYLGFPMGISGQELSRRSHVQAQKFGADFVISRNVVRIDGCEGDYSLVPEDGQAIRAKSIVIATGAKYRRLHVANYDKFEYQGIHYAATSMESDLCRGEEVIVIGGGNSAGQAALFLAQTAQQVYLITRGDSFDTTMSSYLMHRILAARNITLCRSSEVAELRGDDRLQSVCWHERRSGEITTRLIRHMFVMIGADPHTQWLRDRVATDEAGFVLTGADAGSSSFFGTTLEGVYAVGDVRHGSTKRVASAVGEGSCVISDVHRYLATHVENRGVEPIQIPIVQQPAAISVNEAAR